LSTRFSGAVGVRSSGADSAIGRIHRRRDVSRWTRRACKCCAAGDSTGRSCSAWDATRGSVVGLMSPRRAHIAHGHSGCVCKRSRSTGDACCSGTVGHVSGQTCEARRSSGQRLNCIRGAFDTAFVGQQRGGAGVVSSVALEASHRSFVGLIGPRGASLAYGLTARWLTCLPGAWCARQPRT
jgi:hypothetical protein